MGKELNRVITYTGFGYELEADPRHREMIVEQMGVSGLGSITTAGLQNEEVETAEQEEKLDPGDRTLFRGGGRPGRCSWGRTDPRWFMRPRRSAGR